VTASKGVAALIAVALVGFWSDAANAYRPFDGTDAAVAEAGEIEVELGPVEYLRDAADRSLFAPDLRINYGFAPGWEASLEGDVAHGLTAGIPGVSVVAGEALLKSVLREGSLQEKPGPSIATEFGILLPGINDEHGTGAILTGIVSHRWDWATVHANAQIALTREQHADYFFDTIIEGPYHWVVRPVSEIFYERDVGLLRTPFRPDRGDLAGARQYCRRFCAARSPRQRSYRRRDSRWRYLRLRRDEGAGYPVGLSRIALNRGR